MVSISNVQCGLKAFTNKGYRLLSKETGIKLDANNIKALKDFLPENARSMDVVVIQSKFGGGHKHITSVRDEKGGLIRRIISEFEKDKEISKTVNRYNRNEAKTFLVAIRKKSVQEKNVSEIREAFSLNKNADNYLCHCKLTINKDAIGNMHEKQFYESLRNHKKSAERGFIKTEALRLADGRLVDKKAVSNLCDAEKLKKDPYLFTRNYSYADFLKAMFPYAKKHQGVDGRKIDLIDKRLKRYEGFSISIPFYKRIVIDSQKGTKSDLVNALNHELRHQWQNQLLKDYNVFNFFLKKNPKKIAPENAKLARDLWKADVLYCPPELSFKKYWKNFKEVDARKAGEKAEQEFQKYNQKLAELFPLADKKLFFVKPDLKSESLKTNQPA